MNFFLVFPYFFALRVTAKQFLAYEHGSLYPQRTAGIEAYLQVRDLDDDEFLAILMPRMIRAQPAKKESPKKEPPKKGPASTSPPKTPPPDTGPSAHASVPPGPSTPPDPPKLQQKRPELGRSTSAPSLASGRQQNLASEHDPSLLQPSSSQRSPREGSSQRGSPPGRGSLQVGQRSESSLSGSGTATALGHVRAFSRANPDAARALGVGLFGAGLSLVAAPIADIKSHAAGNTLRVVGGACVGAGLVMGYCSSSRQWAERTQTSRNTAGDLPRRDLELDGFEGIHTRLVDRWPEEKELLTKQDLASRLLIPRAILS